MTKKTPTLFQALTKDADTQRHAIETKKAKPDENHQGLATVTNYNR